ncbi:3-methyl-2-oxobutanoate hydroxymethyltransferase [Pseudomonas aeruginosa]
MARLLDPHADLLLVGDSLGMVLYGMPSTLGVSLEMMVAHTLAVMRGSRRACVVADLPFASYRESPRQAFRNAARLLADSGAQAVKLEAVRKWKKPWTSLVRRGIPVLAHIGLMPQQVNAMGDFKARGRDRKAQERVRRDGPRHAARRRLRGGHRRRRRAAGPSP